MKEQKKEGQVRNGRAGRDTHIYFDDELWEELDRLAEKEDRSVTATVRVLIKEALQARAATAQPRYREMI